MDNSIVFALNLLHIKPKTFNEHGWWELWRGLRDFIDFDPSDKTLPKDSRDMERISKEYVQEIMRTNDAVYTGINADDFITKDEGKRDKIFKQWLSGMEQVLFPCYALSMSQPMMDALAERYMFTLADDGSVIAYYRPDMSVNVWEECPDSEKPFSRIYGDTRELVEHITMLNYLTKNIIVYMKDKVIGPFPFYKLYIKYRQDFLNSIKGKPENVRQVVDLFNSYVKGLKDATHGKYMDCELERGLQLLEKNIGELDDQMPFMKFLYKPKIELPNLTNDPEQPGYSYFDLNNITEGETPDFDGFMEAVEPSCRDSLMAAIYATFFAKCRLNQYIWIHGEGGDGKSSLLNAIAAYAGDRLACSLGQTMNSDFGLENAMGKRMVILSDVKTGLSVKSQLIHNLTGHDPIAVNRKNKPIITVRLNPIVWIAANEAPDVNFDNRNEARRCLYIKMCEPPEHIQKKFYFLDENGEFVRDNSGRKINNGYDLEGGLLKEMPHILFKCKQVFERICPAPYSVIRPNINALQLAEENCVDIDAATFTTYIQETFSFTNKDSKLTQTEIFEAVADTMRNHSDKNSMNQFVKRDIRRLLTVKYGCQRKKIAGIYYMTGISRKAVGYAPNLPPAPDPVKMPAVGDFV